MSEGIAASIDGRLVTVYPADGDGLPLVFSNDFQEGGQALLERCRQLYCPLFHLVTVSGFEWDQNLSPWKSDPVVAQDDCFEGNAAEYLQWFLDSVVPFARQQMQAQDAPAYIAGYSMAGLFALWSLYRTDAFAGAVSGSGSLWFPGFREFALDNPLACEPQGIYLSLGDKESKVRNPTLQLTEPVTRELAQHYERSGIRSTFELNQGNHFKNVDLRMAKGIRWMLS